MTADELRTLAVEKQLDARGVSCPGPLLETKRAITGVPSGGVMEILSSDCGTP
ncbi:MAG TPA: sulfurtransferase TusA family protein, partial [Candidatus Hydrogenedentes bacterium]|nr:sulfurtransferase TusA family protein [Candidatus Hydrogenedentota bacterium]